MSRQIKIKQLSGSDIQMQVDPNVSLDSLKWRKEIEDSKIINETLQFDTNQFYILLGFCTIDFDHRSKANDPSEYPDASCGSASHLQSKAADRQL